MYCCVRPRTNQSHRLSVVASVKASEGPTSRVLLQTVQVQVKGKSGTADVVMLLDTGSDRTYISEALVRKIEPGGFTVSGLCGLW